MTVWEEGARGEKRSRKRMAAQGQGVGEMDALLADCFRRWDAILSPEVINSHAQYTVDRKTPLITVNAGEDAIESVTVIAAHFCWKEPTSVSHSERYERIIKLFTE